VIPKRALGLDGKNGHIDVIRFTQTAGRLLIESMHITLPFICIDDEFRYFVLSMLVVRKIGAA